MSNSNQHVRERQRLDFAKIQGSIQIPNLIEVQKKSYQRFLQMDCCPASARMPACSPCSRRVFPIRTSAKCRNLEFVDYAIGNWECKCGNLKGLHHLRATCRNCGASVVTNLTRPATSSVRSAALSTRTPRPSATSAATRGHAVEVRRQRVQERGMTYSAPSRSPFASHLRQGSRYRRENIRDIKEQEVFYGDIPLMTDNGTFIINGTERVIVSQFTVPPVSFSRAPTIAPISRQIIPYRGSWVEFEYDTKNISTCVSTASASLGSISSAPWA